MVPWKILWIALGGAVTLAVGLLPLPSLLDLHPAITIGATVVLMVAAIVTVRLGVKYAVMFMETTADSRTQIITAAMFAVLAHSAWIVVLQFEPAWWTWWPLIVVALCGAEYLGAIGWEWKETRSQQRTTAKAAGMPERLLTDTDQVFVAGLHRSGLGSLGLMESEELRDSALG